MYINIDLLKGDQWLVFARKSAVSTIKNGDDRYTAVSQYSRQTKTIESGRGRISERRPPKPKKEKKPNKQPNKLK